MTDEYKYLRGIPDRLKNHIINYANIFIDGHSTRFRHYAVAIYPHSPRAVALEFSIPCAKAYKKAHLDTLGEIALYENTSIVQRLMEEHFERMAAVISRKELDMDQLAIDLLEYKKEFATLEKKRKDIASRVKLWGEDVTAGTVTAKCDTEIHKDDWRLAVQKYRDGLDAIEVGTTYKEQLLKHTKTVVDWEALGKDIGVVLDLPARAKHVTIIT